LRCDALKPGPHRHTKHLPNEVGHVGPTRMSSRNHSALWRATTPGYCAETADGWAGDCAAGLQGSWGIRRWSACVERCERCARCNFVSFSDTNRDCSWHFACAVESLNSHGIGGSSYVTARVKPRAVRSCLLPSGVRRPPPPPAAEDVHVVTFYSEGAPRDAGLSLTAQVGLLEAAFAPFAGSFRAYTPSEVATLSLRTGERGADVLAPDPHEARMNAGFAALGHMAVKVRPAPTQDPQPQL
jgi:hypothetical protein